MAGGLLTMLRSAGRTLKNVNTGGRGFSGLFKRESWINPMQVNLKTGEMGRKIKNGVSLKEANKQLGVGENDKLIGTLPHGSGKGVRFFIKNDNGRVRRVDTHRKNQLDYGNKSEEALQKATKAKGFNYAPFRYDTDALTKKSTAIGLAGLGGLGYGVNRLLSSDNESELAKTNNAQNTKTTSDTENDSENKFGIADAEPSGLFKSGVNKPDNTSTTLIQPPKAKTDVKPKKSSSLNYNPIAEWAKADQATNDKWLKRQADYKKLVDEGVDPYEAYDRSMQEQSAEPASTTNTSRPAQKATRPTYTPMSTDQAVDAYRKQRYKNY